MIPIGVAIVDSTPEIGTYLAGYPRRKSSTSVRDPLRASAVAFGETPQAGAIWLSLDLLFMHETMVARVREAVEAATGVPSERTLVACSHSHSSPLSYSGAPASAVQEAYNDRLVECCREAAATAWAGRRPAAMRFVRGESRIGMNRRLPQPDGSIDFGWNEAGSQDHELLIVRIVDQDDEPVGTLVNHPCHVTVLPPKNLAISADWVGDMRRTVEEGDDGVPCVFVQGACADINPHYDWYSEDDSAAAARIGATIGRSVLDALAGPFEAVPDGPVLAAVDSVRLGLTPEVRRGRELPYWRGILRKVPLPRILVDRLLDSRFPWRTAVRRNEAGRWEVPIAVQAFRIGGLALGAHGSETFHETGKAVRRSAPTPFALFAGYSNGMVGYVPTAAAAALGGYEVDTTPYLYRLPGRFAADSEERARSRVEQMLGVLWLDDGRGHDV